MSDPQVELQDLRKRVLDGEELSAEEMSVIINSLRKTRTAAEQNSAKNKKSAAKPLDIDSFMAGIE